LGILCGGQTFHIKKKFRAKTEKRQQQNALRGNAWILSARNRKLQSKKKEVQEKTSKIAYRS